MGRSSSLHTFVLENFWTKICLKLLFGVSSIWENSGNFLWKVLYIFIGNFRAETFKMCGNKMPTKCNRGFYCRSYCLLNMFRASPCPSSGLCVRFAGCCNILQTGHITLSSTPDQQLENHTTKYHRQQPLYDTLKLLMMGIVLPGTCWASNKICNKNLCCI